MSRGDAITLGASTGYRYYTVCLMPMADVAGNVAGYLVTYSKDRVLATFWEEFLTSTIGVLAALGLIVALIMGLRRRTAALDLERRNLKIVTDVLAEGVFVIDQGGLIVRINSSACQILGYEPDELIDQPIHERLHKHGVNQFVEKMGQCPILYCGQTVDSSDRVLILYDGPPLPALKTVTRIMTNGREKLLACFIDISSRIAAEEALKSVNKKLKSAIVQAEMLAAEAEADNRSKSLFLANMSHVIRTPLNAILGYSQLLQQDASLSREHLEQVGTINRIMSLVDVYEALRARRPDKPPFSHDKSRAIIMEGRGIHFDPQVVDGFSRIDAEFDAVYSSMTDG